MKTKKGFTLIELLIVIAIIGILSAALLPTILNAPARGRDAARIGQINSIVAALEAYNSDNGGYPAEIAAGVCVSAIDTSKFGAYFSGGKSPVDPAGTSRTVDAGVGTGAKTCIDGGDYYYRYLGTVGVAEYIIGTVMENANANNSTDDLVSALTFTPCAASCTHYVLIK